MADNVFNSALKNLMNGGLDLDTNDIRAKLLMTNTTADTEVDAIDNVSDITTLDLCDATDYADVALADEAVTAVDASDLAKFDATDITFSGLGGDGTRDYQGVLIYKYVDGTDANDIPIVFLDFTIDIAKESTSVTVPWNTSGILTLAKAA